MPYKPARPCAASGCPILTTNKERLCDVHLQQRQQQADAQRGSSTERGYDARWQRASKMYLREHPLCVQCQEEGRVTAATVVDHIIPHKGNYELFWDESNWQSSCKTHHDIKTAKEDGAFGNKEKH